jgi:hypothetical protein
MSFLLLLRPCQRRRFPVKLCRRLWPRPQFRPADWMHPSQATPDMAPELKNAVNHGLNQTNGFGTYTLTDGTEVHPNVISRLIDHHGNLVDPETIAQVTDHNGKLLYVKPPPEVSAPPVAPVAPGSVPTGLIPDFPVDQLRTDPERFQYKLGSGQGGESTGDHASLAGGEPGGLFPPENGSAPEGGAAGPDGGAVHEKPAVTERLDAADHAAQARIKARAKGRVSSGVDPADIADLTIVGAAKLGKGVITFRDWSKEMLGEFGEDLRPHLSALYAAAHDHVQALTDTGAEPLPHMAAVQAARAPAEGSDAPGQHGKTKKPQASYAGSINLGNLTTTPQAKALIQAASEKIGRGDPLTHDEIRTAAKALHLTHEMLAQITPGEVPSGVHPAIFQKKVRDMHVADAESAEQAVAAHTANPTPETEKAVEAANAKLLSIGEHAQLLARRPAQTLSSLNMDSSAWETALEKAADKAKTLAKTPTLASLSPKVKSVQPARVRSKDFGAGNKVFTTQARDEALARIKAASGRVNSGIDPALFKDAVIVAGHYIEGGIRQYAPLAAEMRTHFPDATEGELQRVYAAARAEAAAGITKQQRATASAALADRLAPSMGRQGVSDFLDSLSPPVLDKLLNDGKFTDAEARSLSAAYQSHVKVKTAAPPLPAIKTLRAAVRDAKAGRLGYDSAKAAVREELLKSAVSGDIKSAVRQGLLKDVPPEKQASVIAAKRKEIIAAHQKKIITALAGVKDDDFHALANVYNKFNPVSGVDKIKTVQQSSLLSGPKTLASIALAHTIGAGFEDLAVRPLAAYLSGGTVQGLNLKATGAAIKAGVRAIPEGGQMIKEGPTAMQLRGIHGGLRMEEAGGTHLHGEPVGGKMAFARAPGRVHAALYHIVGAALEERGIQEFSALKAHREGGTAASYRADPDVVKAAKEFRQEQLYQNKNKASSMIGAAANQGGPVGKVVVNTLLPFRNVPMNLAGRGLEYSGAGVPVAAARLAQAKISGQVITPELRRSLAMQAARGIAGPVAGMSAGAALTAKGVLNPSNEKSYENGSVNLGRNKYDISRLQPVSTPLLEGGELYNYLHNQELERKYGGNAATKYLVKQGEKPVDFLAPLADNPYLNVGQQIQDIHDGMSGKGKHKVEKVIGSLIGELSPTILSQIAAATDPSGNVRKKQAAWDYLMNRVPILREMLPVGKFPQSSNYKSTGLLSLLSPVNVTPHSKSGIRKLSEYKK